MIKRLFCLTALQEAKLFVSVTLGDPYTAKPSLGGMTAYPLRAMAAVCIVMEAERKTYRKMVGHLRNNRDTVAKIGLRKIPSKSTIARAYGLIPDRYLAEVHRRVICEISAGSVAGDSTGYSDSSFVRWYDVRTDSVKTKRGWVKLHSIIDIQTRVVLDYSADRKFLQSMSLASITFVSNMDTSH